VKRAALYLRVSTLDQHPETQLYDLEQMARRRAFEIVERYKDRIRGTRARRPGLDKLMEDARRGQFDVVVVWACDRLARSVRHFLEVLDELNHLNVEFVSFREQLDTGGPLGRAIVVIISVVAELERSLIVERVRAGMRRAKLEGRHIGRPALQVDQEAILRDRARGVSVRDLAKMHRISRTSVTRLLPAVRVADLVKDFLVLINHDLELFLEFWCGHPLPYVASAGVATCAVTLLFAPALKKSQPRPHCSGDVLQNDRGASSLSVVAGVGSENIITLPRRTLGIS
jgi:DNA invertase Pin-like site-specific DNA recombinase